VKTALVKQALDVFGPWSGVKWADTSPLRLFDVWPGKAVYWELTCMLQADWYIIPPAVEGDYFHDLVRRNPDRAQLLQRHTKNLTSVDAIPFENYDLIISFDAILEIPPSLANLFAYYTQEHWDALYGHSLQRPLNGYDLFLAHMMDAYSADVIKMSPGSPNRGKEDLERSYADLLAKYNVEVAVKVEEVTIVSNSTAFDRARYTVIATPKTGGKPLVSTGRLLEVLRKENGKWKSFRAMNILDEPQS